MTAVPTSPLPRVVLVVACLALPARVLADDAAADEGGPAISAEVDVVSQYVWRTLAYSEGAVVQPSVNLARGPASLNVWANVDPSLTGAGRFNEVDVALAWTLERGPVEATPSMLLYTYPHAGEANTGELQVEVTGALPRGLAVFVRHSRDVLDYPGASFTVAGLGHERTLERGATLTVSAQIGRGSQRFSDAYLPGIPALSVAGLSASGSIPLGGGWAARPHVDWLEVLGREARALLPERTPVAFGIALVRSGRDS
jgi:hypothetical protein